MHDYVIVGAGSAGCVVANRLTADPAVRVLLLEAGGPDKKTEIHIPAAFAKLFNTEYDWAYSTAPEPALAGRELFWPRGKTLGGSSSLSAQMYVRGNRADYDAWARSAIRDGATTTCSRCSSPAKRTRTAPRSTTAPAARSG